MCGTPLSTDAGAAGAKFDLAAAKAELKASGYKGEPVIILEVAGSISQTASRLLVQNMRDVGFTVDQQPRDWPTVLARRAKKGRLVDVSGLLERHRHVLAADALLRRGDMQRLPGLVLRQPRA
jgi:ABC-type dipeptide transport system, periplasmic component